jgi:hypothetical protein
MTWLPILRIATVFSLSPLVTAALAREDFGARLRAEFEGQRLEDLRERLRATLDPRTDDPDRQIERLTHEIDAAEAALRAPAREARPAGTEEYLRAHHLDRARRDLATRQTLADVRRRLATAEDSPEALANLREWHAQLERDLQRVDAPAAGEDADGERQVRWRAARARLEARIADWRGDLRYWSARKSGAGSNYQKQRVQMLRQQIKAQEMVVGRSGPAGGEAGGAPPGRVRSR